MIAWTKRNPMSSVYLLSGSAAVAVLLAIFKHPLAAEYLGAAGTGAAGGYFIGAAYDCGAECLENPCSH